MLQIDTRHLSAFVDVTSRNIHLVPGARSSIFDDVLREDIFKTKITNKFYLKMLNFVSILISFSPIILSCCVNFLESDYHSSGCPGPTILGMRRE